MTARPDMTPRRLRSLSGQRVTPRIHFAPAARRPWWVRLARIAAVVFGWRP